MTRAPLILIIVCLLAASCGKKEEVGGDARPQPAASASSAPAAPLPDRPAPDVTKSAQTEYPKPGQTNNHSSPDFKGGTASDTK